LNPDAVWSDGQPITAHDYVWAWQHVQDPETASGYASFAYVVKNAEKINTGEIEDFSQLGIKALDDYTLEVTLEQPATFFPRLLDFPTMFPLRQDVIEEHGDDWVEPENIVSNGRWNFVEWEKDVKLVFERNPLYWGEPAAIETIEYYLMDDVLTTSPAMYEADELDISRFAPEEYARISSDSELGDEVEVVTASGMSFVVFDCGSPPFDDVRVRQAFHLAIDRENLVKGVLQGLGEPAYILPPPGIEGRNEDAYIGTRNYEEDVARAQELMAEAGYPNGEGFPVVELKYSTSAQNEKMGQAIPAMWKEALGIEVNQEPTEAQAYREWFRSRADQPFDMMLYGWGSDYEDPYNYFNTIWPSWSDLYHTHWVNEEYDTLAKEAGLATDREERVKLYEQVDVVLEREVPFTPTYFWVNPFLRKPWVQGEIFNRRQGYPVQWAQVVSR
jgi:oligopeptide transport system substrate-binding protein